MKFDIVLYERELDRGLNRIEISELLNICEDDEIIPIEIQGENSVAMGFIGLNMASEMNYVYDNLEEYIKGILNDMDKETENHTYKYDVYKIFLDR